MEVVIDITEQDYQLACKYPNALISIYAQAIKNGTPLPKGHGRLIDANAIIDTLGCSDGDIYVKECIEEDAPTIIEADTGE